MTKTIYIRKEDVHTVEDAELLTGRKLSPLFIQLVRDWVENVDPDKSKREALKHNLIKIKS